jgi:phosphate transport system protein
MSTGHFFEKELTGLKERIVKMGTLVEEQIASSIKTYVTRDALLARQTIQNDHQVNKMDVEIDDECIRLLALYQPAARDLRFITTAMKIATDLERMSDLSEDICERAIELLEEDPLNRYSDDIIAMATASQKMVVEALDAFVSKDVVLARKVCGDDQFVDELTHKVFKELLSDMIEDPAIIARAIRVSFIGKYIERIADHATNIAEVVVYLVEGKIIRHTVVE